MRSPLPPQQVLDLALEHHRAGRLREAEQLYRQLLQTSPNQPDVLHVLGLLADQIGRMDVAIDLIRRAIAISPSNPVFHCNLGNVLQNAGQLGQAIASFHRALELQPVFPDALFNLGNALRAKGELTQAIAVLRQAIAQRPDFPQAYNNLATTLKDAGEREAAIAAARQAVLQQPQFPEAYSNLGNLLLDADQFDEAIAAIRTALSQHSRFPEAHYNLGNALRAAGHLEQAAQAYRDAIALQPNFPMAQYNLGLTMLLLGDFKEGWELFEYRWDVPEFQLRRQPFAQPLWDGSNPAGKRIFIHAEQGFGDIIHMSRYATLLARQGARVTVACGPELLDLLRTLEGVENVVLLSARPLPEFDLHCPLLSLPRVIQTRLESIPAPIPYLGADPRRSELWRQRLPHDQRLKVGIVWTGRSYPNRWRMMPLSKFLPLAQVPGVCLISLQKKVAEDEARNPPQGMSLLNFADDIKDFAETAALIDNLDLVISIDTAVAHLAGAMGKPVWTLLPAVLDWRWMIGRDDSPWYPTMRLLRQDRINEWGPVIQRAAEMLAQFRPA